MKKRHVSLGILAVIQRTAESSGSPICIFLDFAYPKITHVFNDPRRYSVCVEAILARLVARVCDVWWIRDWLADELVP